jgi:RNA polymerase sigma factor FliA
MEARTAEKLRKAAAASKTRNALVTRYHSFVHAIVAQMIYRMGLPSDYYDEFISAGYLGLVEAAGRFDSKNGADFKTYAYLRIRGAVIDSIRATSELQGRAYKCARAVRASIDLREVEFTYRDSLPESADKKRRLAGILDYAAKSALAFRLSINDVQDEVQGLEAQGADPEAAYMGREDRQVLKEIVHSLPRKERRVLDAYYFQGKSLSEIAASQKGLSKSWVSRLHARGLELVKKRYLERQIAAGAMGRG